jgi:hypothetical protein
MNTTVKRNSIADPVAMCTSVHGDYRVALTQLAVSSDLLCVPDSEGAFNGCRDYQWLSMVMNGTVPYL